MKSERIPVKSFSADNGFIGKMQKLVREEVLPYQYNILNDAIPGIEKSHAIENIRLAAEKLRGKDVKPDEFYGMVFQDSDVAKWIEAAAYALAAGLKRPWTRPFSSTALPSTKMAMSIPISP